MFLIFQLTPKYEVNPIVLVSSFLLVNLQTLYYIQVFMNSPKMLINST